MTRITGLALVATALLMASGAFAADQAGDKACCAQKVANTETAAKPCADLTALNLNADQKTKLEAWQADCMKDGCTKESRHKFLQQAKGILSAEQFSKLKAECKSNKDGKGNKGAAKTTT
jgi:hypothetical protein